MAIIVFYGIDSVGGMDQVIANAKDLPGYFSFNSSYNAATNSANQYGIITIISTLAWGLGYFGMPHILLRFMAIDDPENVKLSRRIASTWVVISMAAAILIGIIGFSMSTEGILGAYGSFDSETIIAVSYTHLLPVAVR